MYSGPFTLNGLPTAYATEDDTVDTLELVIEDAITKVQVTLLYSVFEEKDIIIQFRKEYGLQDIQSLINTNIENGKK